MSAIVHEFGPRKILKSATAATTESDTVFELSPNGQQVHIEIAEDSTEIRVTMSPVTCADVCLFSSYCRRLGKQTLRFVPGSDADRDQLKSLGMPECIKDVYEHIKCIRWFAPPSIAGAVQRAVGLSPDKRQDHEEGAEVLIGPVAKLDLSRDYGTAVAAFFTDTGSNPLLLPETYKGMAETLLVINLLHVPLPDISVISDHLSCFEKRRR